MVMRAGGDRGIVPCTLVGDGMVGKTTLAQSFVNNKAAEDSDGYIATVFDNYAGTISTHGTLYTVNIFDTPGQHDYEQIRTFSYQDSEVIVVCYSVADIQSFINVREVWFPEVKSRMKRKRPIVLVGCQADLRRPDMPDHVTRQSGLDLAKEMGADCYLECSAVSQTGVTDVFRSVVDIALKSRKKRTNLISRLLRR